MRRKVLTVLVAALGITAMLAQSVQAADLKPKALERSDSGNPMLGFDENGNILYGGDPSILVDGDTVYCYVGHDTSSNESYYMPDWRCYSSKDMVNWKYESMIMSGNDISWAANNHECWAAQVMKYKDKYYFYYCTETNSTYGGGKSIGVAVSDSATGPFKDIGKPLVRNIDTTNGVHTWEDIDPTAWIETDPKTGEEHRVLGWGNNRFFNCELNEDMISIKDRDGNPDTLSCGYGTDYDIAIGKVNDVDRKAGMNDSNSWWLGDDGRKYFYTEAPYYYRQQDENGNYYGKYYMFFATNWREEMGYATCDTYEQFLENDWDFGGRIMEPSCTANTNHMAVFDFKGQTYFVFHDGSLPHGSGYRRVACVEKMYINEDGTIDPIEKTATGLAGKSFEIQDSEGKSLMHENFENVIADSFYPIRGKKMSCGSSADLGDADWVINPGKTSKNDKNLVSIESNNKPGLYMTADSEDSIVLSQDVAGSTDEAQRMTFKTWEGMDGSGVTFESVKYPGYYLTSNNGVLSLSQNPEPKNASFEIFEGLKTGQTEIKSGGAMKTKRFYAQGDTLKTDDIRVSLYLTDGRFVDVKDFKVDASGVNMNKVGTHTLKVSYKFDGKTCTDEIKITVVEPEYLK